jgi:hypothetical protein
LKSTTTTGALSIAVAGDFPTLNQNTTGTAANVTGTVAIANGGTGQTTKAAAYNALTPITTTGDLVIGNGANSATRLAIGTNGQALISNGTTAVWSTPVVVTSVSGSGGTTGLTLTGGPITSTGTLTLGGTLAIANGGTGQTTASAAFNALSPVTTTGDLIVGNGTNSATRLAIGSANTVLTSNGTTASWTNTVGANATGTVGVSPAGGGTAWTLISGTQYYADFVHNLGTTNVVITLFDTNDSSVVIANKVVTTSTTTVRITVTGNTKTVKVVVVANGLSIVAGGSTPSSVITAKDGVTVSAAATKLNFAGQAVNVVDAGSGTTNITIGSRFTFFANSLDSPNNADYAVNALAPVTTDPTYASLNVRSFSNTTEQGVGFLLSVPTGATTMTIKIRGRATTAPGATSNVQPRVYARLLPNNSTVGAWASGVNLSTISIPTNANFQYFTQTISLATLGLTAGNLYQIEMTRYNTAVTNNLAFAFLMAELTVEIA